MSLADDPGCSVLSLTSKGLISRSNLHYGSTGGAVALWRDCAGNAREIELPDDKQAILLTLNQVGTKEYTLDGRGADSKDSTAYQWLLAGCLPIAADRPVPA